MLHTVNRWWGRNHKIVIVGGLSVVLLGTLRAANLLPVRELYRILSQPFWAKSEDVAVRVNAQTAQLQQRIQALEDQNQSLEKLLKQPQVKKPNIVTALVIGRATDQWWQHVHLNQGSDSGLGVDAVVESAGALAGRIVTTSPQTSQVLLVSDPNSRLAVQLSRSRSIGILQGTRDNQGNLEFFDRDPDVKVGDTVITSTLSCLFPPNIPVGIVKSIDRTNKSTIRALVEFTVPLGRLEWVQAYQYEKTKKKAAEPSTCP